MLLCSPGIGYRINVQAFIIIFLISLQWLHGQSAATLVWSDEFEGMGIPDTSKWDQPEYNRRNNDKGPDGWWSKEDSFLDGKGNLVMSAPTPILP